MWKIVGGATGRQNVCHLLVLLSLFAFQSLHLDSDPSPLKLMGDFNDEGFWNHAARCKVLFGTFVPDEFNQGVIASPLFTLIQWSVFSLLGVSTYAARLQPLVSFWLIILMVYFLTRRHASANAALLAALMLGVLHEVLMYVQWSTPIITETCFLVAVFFFWDLARTGSQWWAAAAGAALVAASLTTTLAVYYVPSILLFLGVSVFLRKEVDRRRLTLFLGTASVLAVLVAALYYLPNHQQVKIFLGTMGHSFLATIRDATIGPSNHASKNASNDPYGCLSGNPLLGRFAVAFLEPFGSAGAATLMMIVSLWLVDFVARLLKEGVRPVLRQMSSLELYCVCWLSGALPSIVVTPYMPNRRLVIFLVPLVVIAALFTWRVWNAFGGADIPVCPACRDFKGRQECLPHRGEKYVLSSPAANLPGGYGRIVLWIAMATVWYEYMHRVLTVLDARWLYRTSWSVLQPPIRLVCVAVAISAIVAIITGICFLGRKVRLSLAILLVCFFATNIALDLIWWSHATYTVRDKSRELGGCTEPGQYVVDGWAWQLSLENRCLPIFSPWFWWGNCVNNWFVEESDRVSFLLNRHEQFDGYPLRQDLLIYDFPRERVSKREEVRLCPVPFAPGEYRYVGTLCLIRPPQDSSAKKRSDVRGLAQP